MIDPGRVFCQVLGRSATLSSCGVETGSLSALPPRGAGLRSQRAAGRVVEENQTRILVEWCMASCTSRHSVKPNELWPLTLRASTPVAWKCQCFLCTLAVCNSERDPPPNSNPQDLPRSPSITEMVVVVISKLLGSGMQLRPKKGRQHL